MPQKKLLGVLETSRRTGVSAAHVSKIFKGTRRPSLHVAALIATANKISLDELYGILAAKSASDKAAPVEA